MRSTELRRDRARGTILPLAALLLFCMAMLALWMAQLNTGALRLATQEVRARELFAAAGVGLETALAQAAPLLANAPPVFDADGRFRIAGPAGAHGDGVRYETFFHNKTLLPFDPGIVEIEAKALDESGGVRRQRQQARLRPWLATIPSAPLIAHRGVSLPSELSLRNAAGDVLAWSGGAFSAPGAALDVPAATRCPPTGICDWTSALATFEADAAFEYWFARERATLRTLSATHADVGWLEADGDVIIEGAASHGSALAPRLLIIAGDLEVRGTLAVHGVLYVNGSLTGGAGEITIHGAMIVAGDAMHQGPMTIDYEPGALQALAQRGSYVRIPGSWNDF